jgi:hypothetical protein
MTPEERIAMSARVALLRELAAEFDQREITCGCGDFNSSASLYEIAEELLARAMDMEIDLEMDLELKSERSE